MKYLIISILCAGVIVFLAGLWVTSIVSEAEAISLIKNQYPELQDFPSDGLPPKVIRTEQSSDGWYVMFETQGSGRPLIEAKCFFVDNAKKVTITGVYTPKTDGLQVSLSIKSCKILDQS